MEWKKQNYLFLYRIKGTWNEFQTLFNEIFYCLFKNDKAWNVTKEVTFLSRKSILYNVCVSLVDSNCHVSASSIVYRIHRVSARIDVSYLLIVSEYNEPCWMVFCATVRRVQAACPWELTMLEITVGCGYTRECVYIECPNLLWHVSYPRDL